MSQLCYEIKGRNGEQHESETIVSMSLMWPLSFHVKIYCAVITALFDVSNHYYTAYLLTSHLF